MNMLTKFLPVLFLVATCHAQPETRCVERRGDGGTCFMAPVPADCDESGLQAAYYQDFTGPGGVFNRSAGDAGCPPWRFFLAGNNCRDNPNFHPAQRCNNTNASKPYDAFPRMTVRGPGRLGAADSCVRLTCYPRDDLNTGKPNGRAEMLVKTALRRDSTYWYAWSFRLPDGFSLDGPADCNNPGFRYTHCVIAQFHTSDNRNCDHPTLPFNLNLRKGRNGYVVATNYGAICGDDRSAYRNARFPVRVGAWYDVVLEMTWSPDPARARMRLQAYEAGKDTAVLDRSFTGVPSLFTDAADGYAVLHLGAYIGRNFCNPVSIELDEFSFAHDACCLDSPRVHCPCDAEKR